MYHDIILWLLALLGLYGFWLVVSSLRAGT